MYRSKALLDAQRSPPDRRLVLKGSKTIRGGMGIGDALYVQSVARHLIEKGQRITVCSHWRDVFRPLVQTGHCTVVPFTRLGVDIVAHYPSRKAHKDTSQFEDCCISAGVKGPVQLQLDWTVTDAALVARVIEAAKARPIVCVQMPRPPMGREDGFGKELMPRPEVLQSVVDLARDACLVQFGVGEPMFELSGIDVDLSNQTTVAQMLDVASVASGFIGYPSFFIPLAESLNKPAFILFSQKGFESPQAFIRQITPGKVFHGHWCKHAVDNWTPERIQEAFNALC